MTIEELYKNLQNEKKQKTILSVTIRALVLVCIALLFSSFNLSCNTINARREAPAPPPSFYESYLIQYQEPTQNAVEAFLEANTDSIDGYIVAHLYSVPTMLYYWKNTDGMEHPFLEGDNFKVYPTSSSTKINYVIFQNNGAVMSSGSDNYFNSYYDSNYTNSHNFYAYNLIVVDSAGNIIYESPKIEEPEEPEAPIVVNVDIDLHFLIMLVILLISLQFIV